MISGKVPCDVAPGEYLEKIYVTMEEVNQTYLEEKIFNIHTKEEAFLPNIEFDDLDIGYDGGETEIKITNTGFETAKYDLSLTASDWITLDKTSVELAPGENTTVMLQAYPTEDVWADVYAAELIARIPDEGIEYSLDFFVNLRQETGTPLWIIITVAGGALILLAIITIIVVILSKKKKTKKEKEDVKEDADKSTKKETVTIEKRDYGRKKKDRKEVKIWPIIMVILIAAILAGALYYSFTTGLVSSFNSESDKNVTDENIKDNTSITQDSSSETPEKETKAETEVITNSDIQEPLITIDRSAVPGKGNILEITNETEINIDMIIKNPTDRKATFEVNTPSESWIEFERSKITVLPESTKIINVKIKPNIEALENNDYSIDMNVTLSGKKIQYEESLNFILTKKEDTIKNVLAYWPWALGGAVVLFIMLIIITLASRKQTKGSEVKEKPSKNKKNKEKEPKKSKEKKKTKRTKTWLWIIIIIAALLLLSSAGFWIYNKSANSNTQPNSESNETNLNNININESFELENQGNSENKISEIEEKLTEEDVEESLITIDRSAVPGKGNVLDLEQEKYVLPLSINNPTDRKARFTVSTNNQSWVSFEEYKILVEPESTKTVNMTITPDMEALKESNYMITINTKLEGKKIDYQEELSFIIRKNRKLELSLWLYALAGLIILCLIIIISEIVKRTKKPTSIKKSRKKGKTEKDIADINKELAALRRKTMLKLKKTAN